MGGHWWLEGTFVLKEDSLQGAREGRNKKVTTGKELRTGRWTTWERLLEDFQDYMKGIEMVEILTQQAGKGSERI